MTEIYLVRHPETVHNVNRSIVSGRSNDIELTQLGVEQAVEFSEVFNRDFPKPEVLYSSPALRTRALLDTYLEKTKLKMTYTVDDALQEMGQGIAEGQERTLIYTPEVLARINTELFNFHHEGGESLTAVSDRMLDWVWRAHRAHPESTILVATHGQAIRSVVGKLLGWSHFETTMDLTKLTPNVSVTHLTVDDDKIMVNYFAKQIINQSPSKE